MPITVSRCGPTPARVRFCLRVWPADESEEGFLSREIGRNLASIHRFADANGVTADYE